MGDPKQGTLGKVWGGDYGGAAGDIGGGLGNVIKGSAKVTEAVLNPIGALQGFGAGNGGEEIGLDETQPLTPEQQAQELVNQQNQQAEQKRMADEKRNKEYSDQQAGISKGIADEDAFTQARNAARKAKGNSLFGAWG